MERELKPADMSPDQLECYRLICDLVGGDHHINGKIRECGYGLRFNMLYATLSTFDFSTLTSLVLMAHDRCIRVEIVPSGPGMVGINFHRRHSREGSIYKRHPTMEEHINILRRGRTSL